MNDKKPNKVYLALRKIYCLQGARFCSKELEMGWKEIEKLEAERDALQAKLDRISVIHTKNESQDQIIREIEEIIEGQGQ